MPDLRTLQTLLDQHVTVRDNAMARHLQVQTESDAAQAQVEQLLNYRREYEQRWSAQFSRAAPIELMRHYQSFTERLGQAITQQGQVAQQAAQRAAQARAELQECEMRCASVRKLIERRVKERHLAAERLDQRQTDEMAARVTRGRPGLDGVRPPT